MTNENKAIRTLYTLFLGVMIVLFIGFGINTFYSQPSAPEYPAYTQTYEDSTKQIDEQNRIQKEYETKQKAYEKKNASYSRNVAIITLVASVGLVYVSVAQAKKLGILSDGVMFGGLFTLIYAIIRSVATNNKQFIFIAVSVSLAIVIYLGIHRFVKPDKAKKK